MSQNDRSTLITVIYKRYEIASRLVQTNKFYPAITAMWFATWGQNNDRIKSVRHSAWKFYVLCFNRPSVSFGTQTSCTFRTFS